ncbi:thymopoietin isoform X5 [Canis lupus baileyi]|uniref:Thymopoietin n=2 Tax=Canis lupus familiaris TaxID=9615 RepID=A0A8C0NW71_CANLF|nr:thymopoietin isoform X5 [Canis lupus familiaris]XP_025295353.1 thymopoietin isoform X5 [Canis lupus dingo]XP_038414659.1 thymopoietin isoform X5 [Canis lupus familiaris]XP_038544246.1 thymopoietin isoform X5 [Canis lupus familiaris]XP_055192453.1 thymopoietin isoform X4 [Nyctereutes procyonoides]|eukprot:XP_013975084.1 thymopoietin isoform X5 [Canis lupus familiaris]
MPEFLEDPSVLTKEKLKSELVANNVTLPVGEQRKDVYVQLYLQHLTARNRPPLAAGANSKGPPDFSSDEEREPTPVLGSGAAVAGRSRAAVGRKATKKTDKPRPEDKDDLDVTELTNEDLLDQLVKYGVNPGPIVGTTRKLYEKKLLKLREQGTESRSSTPLPTISSSAENTRQNGSNDSDRYSDNEEDSKIELKLEKREPLKGRAKTPVTLKQRRVEHNQVETSQHFRIDGAIISESTPIAETIMASSNETLVVNRVTGNFKHAAPILPITEFSDIPRRTPKKPLTRAEVGEKTEERRIERDILKEMFPFEASTPTGISASCRRPIKGAAGRPLELSDFRMEESFSTKYIPKYVPLADVKSEKTKKGRSIPMWIKILLFVVVAIFLFLVYQAMETNQGNPFSSFLSNDSGKSI